MSNNKDYFEIYLNSFLDAPSLVIVRSVEAKNFPKEYIETPILDLCCGDGFFATTLGLKNIYGCDISEEAIRLANLKNIYVNLQICDVRKLPYEDNFFKTVISNCALEHVENIEIVLKEVNRVMMNGGYFIITVPSEALFNCFLPTKICKAVGLKKLGKKLLDDYINSQVIKNILPIEIWEKLLKESGFKIVQKFYLFDEKSYKLIVVLDWLWTLRFFRIFNKLCKLTFPSRIRKIFWRKFLKKYYLKSTPLKYGGELVIIAHK